jgi:hypothetical protein
VTSLYVYTHRKRILNQVPLADSRKITLTEKTIKKIYKDVPVKDVLTLIKDLATAESSAAPTQ